MKDQGENMPGFRGAGSALEALSHSELLTARIFWFKFHINFNLSAIVSQKSTKYIVVQFITINVHLPQSVMDCFILELCISIHKIVGTFGTVSKQSLVKASSRYGDEQISLNSPPNIYGMLQVLILERTSWTTAWHERNFQWEYASAITTHHF